MSLTTKIKTIITTLYPDATYILSSKFKANIASFDLTTVQLPLIILDNELTKDAEIKKNNNIQKNHRLLISVLKADDTFNDDSETNVIQEECEEIADRIAVVIYQLDEIRPIGNQKYKITPLFRVFNTGLSGVVIEMQVNENLVRPFCLPAYRSDTTAVTADNFIISSDYVTAVN